MDGAAAGAEAIEAHLARALADCAAGRPEGLRAIFEAEAPRLLGVALRILRDRAAAEEVLQDAFLAIWTRARTYSAERGSARGWVNAVLRNRALNRLRDEARTTTVPEGDIAGLQDARGADATAMTLQALDPMGRLRGCLLALDEPKRRCVLLAYVHGYTHGEIAGRMEVPLGTAKAWTRRGLAALRECME
jgi:RNA polymerase sigma-70 factor (ECF subfamily)